MAEFGQLRAEAPAQLTMGGTQPLAETPVMASLSAVADHTGSEAIAPITLFVKGLVASERQLLEGIVRVSQRDTRRRTPRLALLDEANAQEADLLMLDARDPAAVAWARQQNWLSRKPVIWIDATTVAPGQTLARRPVQWMVLPILLSRAMERGPSFAASSASMAPGQAGPTSASDAMPRRILLVDDSAVARIQLRKLLEQRNFVVEEADSVNAAVRLLGQQPADCVLMDVLMPGVDGYDGCRQIKACFRGAKAIPVVMLTSKSSPFDRIRGKMAGCDAYLTKPVDHQQLDEVLAQHMPRDQRAVPRQSHSSPQNTVVPAWAPAAQPAH